MGRPAHAGAAKLHNSAPTAHGQNLTVYQKIMYGFDFYREML